MMNDFAKMCVYFFYSITKEIIFHSVLALHFNINFEAIIYKELFRNPFPIADASQKLTLILMVNSIIRYNWYSFTRYWN